MGVGEPHHCSLWAAACYLLFVLTRAISMPLLFQKGLDFGIYYSQFEWFDADFVRCLRAGRPLLDAAACDLPLF